MGNQQGNLEELNVTERINADAEEWKLLSEDELMAGVKKAAVTEGSEKIDVTQYIGKKAKIAGWSVYKGAYENPSVLIETEPVEGKIKATRFISVAYLLGTKTFNWFTGSKTDVFMKKHNAASFDELIGKEVIIQLQPSKKDDGRDYLTFI